MPSRGTDTLFSEGPFCPRVYKTPGPAWQVPPIRHLKTLSNSLIAFTLSPAEQLRIATLKNNTTSNCDEEGHYHNPVGS